MSHRSQPHAASRSRGTSLVVAALTGLVLAAGAVPASAQYYDGNGGFESPNEIGRYSYSADPGYRDGSADEDGAGDDQDAPDVSYFYDELEDEGRWVSHPVYGEVFIPHGIGADWRPYTRGYWASTDEHGWYWVSDEPFGWATYHYGRWHMDDRYGWVWVPGTTWAPAWVAWRSSDDYVGWAPLPPDSYWAPGRGLVYDTAIYESPRYSVYWSFVSPAYVTTPGLWRHCAPRHEVTTIIYRTRPHTDYAYVNRRIVNRGVSVAHVRRFGRTEITTYNVRAIEGRHARGVNRANGRTIEAYRPNLSRSHVDAVRRGRPDAATRRPANWTNVDRPRGAARSTTRQDGGHPRNRATSLEGTTYAPARATRGPEGQTYRRPEPRASARARDLDDGPPPGAHRRAPEARGTRDHDPRTAGPGAGTRRGEPREAQRRPVRRAPAQPGEDRGSRGGEANLRGSTYAPAGMPR